jgi:hypothetical protein
MLQEAARWRSRDVRYLSGSWEQLKAVIPEFELSDFHESPDEPVNPFLRSVVRLPVRKAEQRIPVAVVSNNYMLVQHAEVGNRCISAIAAAGVDLSGLRCEIGLSELDEWMNLRLYLPECYSYRARHGEQLDLRVEAFNSVDGSARLTILSGWSLCEAVGCTGAHRNAGIDNASSIVGRDDRVDRQLKAFRSPPRGFSTF